MGLKLGKATLDRSATPFFKLPKALIMRIVTAYQNISDGFGLSCDELEEVLIETTSNLQLSVQAIRLLAREFFAFLDTDGNGLIDGIELLSVLCICSGMNKDEIIEFCLSLCDFNNCAALTFDEVVLALKAAAGGLCKLCRPAEDDPQQAVALPPESKLENIASQVFQNIQSVLPAASKDKDAGAAGANTAAAYNVALEKRSIKDIAEKLLHIPDVCSWIEYFANTLFDNRESTGVAGALLVQHASKASPPLIPPSKGAWSVLQWDLNYKLPASHSDGQAAQQWKSQCALLTPVAFANTSPPGSLPGAKVAIDWVFGFSCPSAGPTVLYTRTSEVLYCVSKYVVVYDVNACRQRVLTQHTATVSALALAPDHTTVASGEDNPSGTILVWQSREMHVTYKLPPGYLHDGVSCLAFNPLGTLLVAVDKRPIEKTVLVIDYLKRTVLFKDRARGTICLGCSIQPKEGLVVILDGQLEFWKSSPQGYLRRPGLAIAKSQAMTATCLLRGTSDHLYLGSAEGFVAQVTGINFTRHVQGHFGRVTCLASSPDGFLSGGEDAKIRSWSPSLEPRFLFDISRFGLSPSLCGLCVSCDGASIVLATWGGDVFEISSTDGADLRGGPILQGHMARLSDLDDARLTSTESSSEGMTAEGIVQCVMTHPSKFEFISLGKDRSLRVVDWKTRTVLRLVVLTISATCVCYSPLGDVLAVGCENQAGRDDCMVMILSEEHLSVVHKFRDSPAGVSCVRYSPEGDTLAVGLTDGGILLYSVNDDYEIIAKCLRHAHPVTYIDYSLAGEWLRSNSTTGELYFFNVDDGALQSNIASMRDVSWASQTCLFTWHSKGIHGIDVSRRVERVTACVTTYPRNLPDSTGMELVESTSIGGGSMGSGSGMTTEGHVPLLLSGSSLGQVRIYRYPVVTEPCEHMRYPAHVGVVCSVMFSYDNQYMVTAGHDGCILLLQVTPDAVLREKRPVEEATPTPAMSTTMTTTTGQASTREEKKSAKETAASTAAAAAGHSAGEDLPEELAFEFLQGADIFGPSFSKKLPLAPASFLYSQALSSSHPRYQWLENIVLGTEIAVTDPQTRFHGVAFPRPLSSQPPACVAALQYIYGFETLTCRGNLSYFGGAGKEIVYTAGAYACVVNIETRQQRIFKHHMNRICAFACTPPPNTSLTSAASPSFCATAEVGPGNRVCIWDTNCTVQRVLREEYAYNLCALAFSDDGKYLVTASNDLDHVVSVYDWSLDLCVGRWPMGQAKLLAVSAQLGPNGLEVWAVGHRQLKRITQATTHFPCLENPDLAGLGRLQTFLCVKSFAGQTVLGTLDGSLYLFRGPRLASVVVAHTKGVTAMEVGRRARLLVTGGGDGVVRCWSEQLDCVQEYHLAAISKCHANLIRAVAFSPENTHLIVGLQGCEVLELTVKDGAVTETLAIKGHGQQVLALAVHPRNGTFATAGDDGVLRLYDSKKRMHVRSLKLETGCRALAFTPDGSTLCVGYGCNKRVKRKQHPKEGAFVILNVDIIKTTADMLKVVLEKKDSNLPVRALAYTLDGKVLCVGSEDNKVYVYAANDQYALKHVIQVHMAAIHALDVSLSNAFLLSQDASGTVLSTSLVTGQAVSAEDVSAERWAMACVPNYYYARSHWLTGSTSRGEQYPLSACRSTALLLTGTTNGTVQLSNYPAFDNLGMRHLPGHTGPAARLRFLAGENGFISVGSEDCLSLQYRVLALARPPQPPAAGTTLPTSTAAPGSGLLAWQVAEREDGRRVFQSTLASFSNSLICLDRTHPVYANLLVQDVQIDGLASLPGGGSIPDVTYKWTGMLAAPSSSVLRRGPPISLSPKIWQVDYHYGLPCVPSHSSVFYNAQGALVYYAGNLGVILHPNGLQRWYTGHRAEVAAMAMNPSRTICVTGERAGQAGVHFWDAFVGDPLSSFSNVNLTAIRTLAFSTSGQYCVAVGLDPWHSLTIFTSPSREWSDAWVVASTQVCIGLLHAVVWEEGDGGAARDYPLQAVGEDGVLYTFRLQAGALVTQPVVVQEMVSTVLLSMVAVPYLDPLLQVHFPVCLYGTDEGFLLCVRSTDQAVLHKISAHNGPLLAILPLTLRDVGDCVLTTGVDGQLRLWSSSLTLLSCLDLSSLLRPSLQTLGMAATTSAFQQAWSLAYHPQQETIACMTGSGELLEISLFGQTGSLRGTGHTSGAVHGLATHPTQPEWAATVGDDGQVRLWHTKYHYCVASKSLRFGCRAVVFGPSGETLLVGMGLPSSPSPSSSSAPSNGTTAAPPSTSTSASTSSASPKDGTLVLLRLPDLTWIREERKLKASITDLQAIRGKEIVAVAGMDGRVLLVHPESLQTLYTLDAQSLRPALRVDVSMDTMYVRVRYQPDRMVYFNVARGEIEANPSVVKDTAWASHAVPYSWNVQAVHRGREEDGGEEEGGKDENRQVTALAIHPDQTMAVAGYANGTVRLFAYPALEDQSPSVLIARVASFPSRLAFSCDGRQLFVLDAFCGTLTQLRLSDQAPWRTES